MARAVRRASTREACPCIALLTPRAVGVAARAPRQQTARNAAPLQVNAPTITVEALAGQFWARYLGGGGYASPEAAAEALLGAYATAGGRRRSSGDGQERTAPRHQRTRAGIVNFRTSVTHPTAPAQRPRTL